MLVDMHVANPFKVGQIIFEFRRFRLQWSVILEELWKVRIIGHLGRDVGINPRRGCIIKVRDMNPGFVQQRLVSSSQLYKFGLDHSSSVLQAQDNVNVRQASLLDA